MTSPASSPQPEIQEVHLRVMRAALPALQPEARGRQEEGSGSSPCPVLNGGEMCWDKGQQWQGRPWGAGQPQRPWSPSPAGSRPHEQPLASSSLGHT